MWRILQAKLSNFPVCYLPQASHDDVDGKCTRSAGQSKPHTVHFVAYHPSFGLRALPNIVNLLPNIKLTGRNYLHQDQRVLGERFQLLTNCSSLAVFRSARFAWSCLNDAFYSYDHWGDSTLLSVNPENKKKAIKMQGLSLNDIVFIVWTTQSLQLLF